MADSKKIINSILVLRILTVLILAASIVVMVLNNYKSDDGTKTSFADLRAYRYVVAVAGIGFVYTLIQIPFALYHACAHQRWLRNDCMLDFDFYGDKVISLMLASGVGVGFGVIIEAKRFVDPVFVILEGLNIGITEDDRTDASNFLDRGLISVGILLAAFTITAVISVLTSYIRFSNASSSTTKKGFFFR